MKRNNELMQSISGNFASQGICIGRVKVFIQKQSVDYRNIENSEVNAELERYKIAIKQVQQELKNIHQQIPLSAAKDIGEFIDSHILMLNDVAFNEETLKLIKHEQCNAEWAVNLKCNELIDVFDQMEDPYLKTRKDDVRHLVNRVLKALTNNGAESLVNAGKAKKFIVVADNLDPSHLLSFYKQGMIGCILEHGSQISHSAILARSLKIPMLINVLDACSKLGKKKELILDSTKEKVFYGYEDQLRKQYINEIQTLSVNADTLGEHLTNINTLTQDGCEIKLSANIDSLDDIEHVLNVGCKGIGLFRTEFLYVGKLQLPTELEQVTVYQNALTQLQGLPLTIRTLDLGAEKQLLHDAESTQNSALGLRAIRLCLANTDLFTTQLKAIYKVASFKENYKRMKLLVPMVTNAKELQQLKQLIKIVIQELAIEGITIKEPLPIGAMIEVPAAAIAIQSIIKEVDFVSIGSNDLMQYTLAVDRCDDSVSYLFDPFHYAIIHLISTIIAVANDSKKPVVLCGELAGDPTFTRLLLGMGLTHFSMHFSLIAHVHEVIVSSNLIELKKRVDDFFALNQQDDVERFVKEINAA